MPTHEAAHCEDDQRHEKCLAKDWSPSGTGLPSLQILQVRPCFPNLLAINFLHGVGAQNDVVLPLALLRQRIPFHPESKKELAAVKDGEEPCRLNLVARGCQALQAKQDSERREIRYPVPADVQRAQRMGHRLQRGACRVRGALMHWSLIRSSSRRFDAVSPVNAGTALL